MGRDERSTVGGDDLERRRSRLEIDLVRKGILVEGKKEEQQAGGSGSASAGQAVKLSGEFLAGVIVGAALGLGFDQVTGLTPWGLVVFLLLGFAAGVLNILRAIGAVHPNDIGRADGKKKWPARA